MSPRAHITTLNLGSQSIELLEFRAQPRAGLILCGYRSREILADPARDATRPSQVVAALREMLDELGIKSGPVNYTVAITSSRILSHPRTGIVARVSVYRAKISFKVSASRAPASATEGSSAAETAALYWADGVWSR
jgi:hypothetical protein